MEPNNQAAPQAQGFPPPAGTDENGNPYWVVNGQRLLWSQMSQLLAQKQQQASQAAATPGRGPEQMPAMSSFSPESIVQPDEGQLERGPQQNFEKSLEQAGERQEQLSEAPEQSGAQEPDLSQVAQTKHSPYIGDSAPATPLSSVATMQNYYTSNQKLESGDPSEARTWLWHVIQKVLKTLSVEAN